MSDLIGYWLGVAMGNPPHDPAQRVCYAQFMPTEHNESITRVIHHTAARAKERGLASHEQWKEAVHTVLTIRPDMDKLEAQRLVEQVMVG